jgi:hypothetical protein
MFFNFPRKYNVGIYFELYNLKYNKDKQTLFNIKYTIRPYSEIRKSIIDRLISLFFSAETEISSSHTYYGNSSTETVYLNLNLNNLPEGKYNIKVQVRDDIGLDTIVKSVTTVIK